MRTTMILCLFSLIGCGCPMASLEEPPPTHEDAGAIEDAPSEGRCCTPECLGPLKVCGHFVDGAPE